MTSDDFNEWSRAMHAHEAHRPAREMARGHDEPPMPFDGSAARQGLVIIAGSAVCMAIMLTAGLWALGRWLGAW